MIEIRIGANKIKRTNTQYRGSVKPKTDFSKNLINLTNI